AQIGADMAQASAMLSEADALARAEGVELPEIEIAWGLGVVRHFTGEHDAAATLLEHAMVLIRRSGDHWAECDCLIRLVMVALERCAEALAAAGAVRRRSLVALAHALTARILSARGRLDEARERLALGCRDATTPLAVSARARAALDEAAQALGTSISTFVP